MDAFGFRRIWRTLDLDAFGFLRIWRIWIWIRCLSVDIGVDRDVKMLISSSVSFAFRALVVFLRRLVIFTGFLDF